MDDVVPDECLYAFLQSIGGDQKSTSSPPVASSDNILQLISNALDDWAVRVLDTECLHEKSASFHKTVESSIEKLTLDGFLVISASSEIRYIADLWTRLSTAIHLSRIGCSGNKRDIISMLLELYTYKLLSKDTFVQCCVDL